MTVKTLTRSFAGGVITPEMFARLDLTRFQTGLAEAINFEIYPHGPAANRTGTEYVLEVKDSTKFTIILPFVYSTTQSYILEFGDGYMRIHTAAATVLEAAKNITGITQPAGVVTSAGHGYTNGQEVFLSGIAGMTQLNGRFVIVSDAAANTFRMKDRAGNYITTGSYTAYTAGGTAARVYEIATPYATADLQDIHFTQSADVVTLVHPSYQQRELRRLGATNWTLTTLAFAPTQAAPGQPTVAATTGGGAVIYQYKATSTAQDGLEESYPSPVAYSTSKAITGVTQANPGVVLAVGHGLAANEPVYISGVGGMTQLNGNDYLVNTVIDVDHITLKTLDGVAVNTSGYGAYTAGGTLFVAYIKNDLTGAGAGNTITLPGTVASAIRYSFYKKQNGLYGYIGQSANVSFVDNNITPDTTRTPPEPNDPFTSATNYPSEASYYQGRRWFTSTATKKQNFWATRSGTESNMSYSVPSRDDDALAFRIASRQANTIRHLVPLSELLVLTSGGEWHLAGDASAVLTPKNIDPKQDGAIGASNVRPIITASSVIYAQDRGGRVREMQFSWQQQSYKTEDISIMAPHLFDAYTVVDMAFARAPHPTGWFVRSDGKMLGLTYVPEHQVQAWHTHETDGTYEACAVVPEGNEDALYVIVNRTIGGRTVRCIERKRTRLFGTLPYAFFVDCGLTYNGAATTTIGGLWHLEGRTVSILGDGAVFPQQVVTNGQITLSQACSVVNVGLPIRARLMTLPVALEAQALGQGMQKNINAAYIRVYQASSVFVGPSYSNLREIKQRTTEDYGSPPALISDERRIVLTPSWNASGQACIQQDQPLPITVLSLTLEVATGG